MDDSEVETRDRRDEAETPGIPLNSAARPAGGLVRRIVGRGAPSRSAEPIIEDSQGMTAVVSRRGRPPIYFLSFVAVVVIPSIFIACYFAFIASDQYVAETRFAVRSAQIESLGDKLKSALSSVTATIGTPVMSGQDAYIVAAYIRSRAIVDDLGKTLDLRAIFRRPEADWLARLKDGASTEELVKYWQNMVSVYVDGPSGAVTVTARAFRREDALTLSNAVIAASEKLANLVSARARQDAMKRAESEVRRSEGQVVAALDNLRVFRDKAGMIDPLSAATSTGALLTTLLAERIKLQNNLFVAVRAMSEDAPTVQAMKTRMEGLDSQIDDLKSKLTGGAAGSSTIAGVLSQFEQLELQRQFAEKLYQMAQDSLERARQKAEAQNIYIAVFVPPALPQESLYPQRLSLSLLAPLGLSILWGIFALIGAAVEDHRF